MKISASKKQLAKIISENGGWRERAKFAAQDQDGDVCFYAAKPTRSGGWWLHDGWLCGVYIFCDEALPNWHQTVLARDEYFHLYPAPGADGWIEWKGGECPVPPETLVICRLLGDHEWKGGCPVKAGSMCWDLKGILDIIAYRLHKPESEVETSKPERVVIEQKPTIEQLAADYKAKLAISQQAQEEADFRRGETEVALDKLYHAGIEIGLDIAIASKEDEDEGEPELVITDWRDLQVGDELTALRVANVDGANGKRCVVVKTQDNANGVFVLAMFDDGNTWWVREWRFNRRP